MLTKEVKQLNDNTELIRGEVLETGNKVSRFFRRNRNVFIGTGVGILVGWAGSLAITSRSPVQQQFTFNITPGTIKQVT